jgi:hypothetical protein
MIPTVNNYPYWRYRQITLIPALAAQGYVGASFQVPESNDYLLQKIHVFYQAVGAAAPTTFTDVQATLIDWSKNKDSNQVPIPLLLVATPGRAEAFVGSGKIANGAYLNSKSIDWFFHQKSSFEIRFTNMATVNGDIIDVMLEGRNVMLPGERL